MKARRAVHAVPVGQRNRRHLQLHCALDQLLRQRRPRQKAERARRVQFNVFAMIRVRRRFSLVILSEVASATESKDLRLFFVGLFYRLRYRRPVRIIRMAHRRPRRACIRHRVRIRNIDALVSRKTPPAATYSARGRGPADTQSSRRLASNPRKIRAVRRPLFPLAASVFSRCHPERGLACRVPSGCAKPSRRICGCFSFAGGVCPLQNGPRCIERAQHCVLRKNIFGNARSVRA